MNSEFDLSRRELLAAGAAAAGAVVLRTAAPAAARATNPADHDLLNAAALLRRRTLSSRELTVACLDRIAARDEPVAAWVRVYHERALADAAGSDRRRSIARRHHTQLGVLDGIPIGIKDIFAIAGLPLTAASKILRGNIAQSDAAAWMNLQRSGMVLTGHTQTHEFAAGNFTPQSANPWDHARTPGGSSGGSAIALASRMIPATIGSDTLGSLRIPAGLCGVTTIKPTHGLASTAGVIPLAQSFDTVGPMARTATDCSVLLGAMAFGPTGSERLRVRPRRGRRPLTGLRVGVPTGSFGGVEPTPAIAERVEAIGRLLQRLGATLVSFPAPTSGADNLSSTSGFEFFLTGPGREIDAYHRRYYPARALDYSSDVAFTLGLLRAANAAGGDPSIAQRTANTLKSLWGAAFKKLRLDVVLQPAAVIETPERSKAQLSTQSIGDPMVVWDYNGFPALVAPAGLSAATGLPIGFQLAAPPHRDRLLLQVAADVQAHSAFHRTLPPGLA